MNTRRTLRFIAVVLCLSAASTAAGAEADTRDFVYLSPDDIDLQAPAGSGLKQALLVGDPADSGLYIMRIEFPPGITSPPHSHNQTRYVTVISGTWYFGMGDSGDCKDTVPLTSGSFAIHPAGAVHFDGSCSDEPVVVEIRGLGPVVTTSGY